MRLIDANTLLDAMPKSDVLLRYQVVDVICNSPSIDVAPVITGETSDGYHTFNELYHHRAVLFSVIVNVAAHFRLKKVDMVESLKTTE